MFYTCYQNEQMKQFAYMLCSNFLQPPPIARKITPPPHPQSVRPDCSTAPTRNGDAYKQVFNIVRTAVPLPTPKLNFPIKKSGGPLTKYVIRDSSRFGAAPW